LKYFNILQEMPKNAAGSAWSEIEITLQGLRVWRMRRNDRRYFGSSFNAAELMQ
jgi:hypothetical protein